MQTHAVIKTISVTEKSMDQTEFLKYTFIVDRRANKQDVKRAVEELFELVRGSAVAALLA